MKNKKVTIIVTAIVILLVGVASGVLLFKIFNNKDNDTNLNNAATNTFGDNELNELVEKINKLNKNFNSGELVKNSEYDFGEGLSCYRYSGTNVAEIKESAMELYVDPIGDDDKYRMFHISSNEEKEILFVCIPDNCELTDITSAEIVDEEENAKLIKFNGEHLYYALNTDGKWKFAMPVSVCATTNDSAQ